MDEILRRAERNRFDNPEAYIAAQMRAGTFELPEYRIVKRKCDASVPNYLVDIRASIHGEFESIVILQLHEWNADRYCTCDADGCEECDANETEECCGRCFTESCGHCMREIVDDYDEVYVCYAFGEIYCEACFWHGLTWQGTQL